MNKKVLVIDDEQDVLDYLTAVLESNGYTVITAINADDGWHLTTTHKPDLICLDIMMPGESGVSFYHRLKKSNKHRQIPVIFVSGMVREEDFDAEKIIADLGLKQPFAYIDKPISVDDFIDAVARGVAEGKPSVEKRGNNA